MPPPSRHDALLNAMWLPYGDTVSKRPDESLSAYVARLRAAGDQRDSDIPEPVREGRGR
jgi:hypothetical protein